MAALGEAAGRSLVFTAAGQTLFVPASGVLEILPKPKLSQIPNSPPALAGVMNFHGTAVPVVHVSVLLGAKSAPTGSSRMVVVFELDSAIGLLVDSVSRLGDGGEGAVSLAVSRLVGEGFTTVRNKTIRTAPAERPVVEISRDEETISLLTFRVAGQFFALPLPNVIEVVALPPDVTPLARSGKIAVGMLPLRNDIIALISLRRLLGLPDGDGGKHYAIVIQAGASKVGLVADDMEGVTVLAQSLLEPVPSILQRGEGDAEIDKIARGGDGKTIISILSPEKLFRNQEIEQAVEKGSTAAMTQVDQTDTDNRQFLVFIVGDETFALPIGAVDEVLQLPDAISRVPNAPDFVVGVINLRGQALPIIDQRKRFAAVGPAGKRPRVMVLTTDGVRAGFIVDAVSEILTVPASSLAQAPAMPGSGARIFDRVTTYKADGSPLLIVDARELLARAERDIVGRLALEGAASPP